ncbi:hypothetical protein [Limobrevibacterium gyesilva]|uniref:Uncharacterized protein n=1 Tax=Limobrevibacterium gyesilva TaxID=2991712 RepID=A0AA41YWK4_9PROT|nr:hypothetical protein [Limobrevibacterium gyesilva]MCW3477700.1 hypothetical protein [Limobrevibacterium gyesilva]
MSGNKILPASAVLLALGLLAVGLAPTLLTFVAAWVIIGLGMGAGLYDPAFSTLGRLFGENARSPQGVPLRRRPDRYSRSSGSPSSSWRQVSRWPPSS